MRGNLIDDGVLNLEKIPDLPDWTASWCEPDRRTDTALHLFYTNERTLPAFAQNDNCAILFEGVIQNRSELLPQLQESARDVSDVEILLLAYTNWGEQLLEKLKGVFLIAFWNKKNSSLLCVRDRCGVYPLFYTRLGPKVFFSTSQESLARHPQISFKINRSALVDFICHRRPIPEETFFMNVKRVMPGHAIRFSHNAEQVLRYWYCFPPDGEVDYISNLSDSGFDASLDEAVRRCMSIGSSAIFLSGGLDSVSIASAAADLARREGQPSPWALSVGFPHSDCNEENRQRAVANGLGMQLLFRSVNDVVSHKGLFWSSLELGKDWSQPMFNFWQPLYLELARRGKEVGCDVIMTGGGGDEWLNVSTQYTADLIRAFDLAGVRRFVANMSQSYNLQRGPLLHYLLWTSGVRPILGLYAGRFGRNATPELLRALMRRRFRKAAPAWVAPDPELKREAEERLNIMVNRFMQKPEPKGSHGFYSRSFVWHFIDTNTTVEMEHQFEAARKTQTSILQPYYDADLIHMLVRISPELLQKGGMEKGLVRQAVARRFPDLKFERQKKVSALLYWQSLIKGEGPQAWKRLGGAQTLIELGVVDRKRIEPVVQNAFISNSPWENHPVWDILCSEAWVRSRSI